MSFIEEKMNSLLERVSTQFWIDVNGRLHKLTDIDYYIDVDYDVSDIHHEIAFSVRPYSDDPIDYLLNEGWILIDVTENKLEIINVPNKKQCNSLLHIGYNTITTSNGKKINFSFK